MGVTILNKLDTKFQCLISVSWGRAMWKFRGYLRDTNVVGEIE